MASKPYIKPERTLHIEQDDLLSSYLHVDCLSSDTSWAVDNNAMTPPSPQGDRKQNVENYVMDRWLLDALHAHLGDPNPCVQPSLLHELSHPIPLSPALSDVTSMQSSPDGDLSISRLSPDTPSLGEDTFSKCRQYKKKSVRSPSPALVKSGTGLTPLLPALHPVQTKQEPLTPKQVQTDCVVTSEPGQQQSTAVQAKRQERLIKNRAAALLSRKRKREHLTALEEKKEELTRENRVLKAQVSTLQGMVNWLQYENQQLRRTEHSDMMLVSQEDIQGEQHLIAERIILLSVALYSLSSDGKTKAGPLPFSFADASHITAATSLTHHQDDQNDTTTPTPQAIQSYLPRSPVNAIAFAKETQAKVSREKDSVKKEYSKPSSEGSTLSADQENKRPTSSTMCLRKSARRTL